MPMSIFKPKIQIENSLHVHVDDTKFRGVARVAKATSNPL